MGGGGDHKEKTTIMVLKVDLQCPCCYKKTKKILCKIPQVRNQLYDEKANTITITVVCCSPERIRDKLCCKGGKTIKSIEIKEPTKPKEPDKPKGTKKPKDAEKPKGTEKPKVVTFEKPKDKAKNAEKPKDGPTAAMVATPWMSEPMMMMPPVQGYPQAAHGCGCGQCYHTGGPCYQYYGAPAPPQPAPYYGNYSYGYGPGPGPSSYGKGCYVNNDYFNDENAQGCTIM
ncbi:uncharacterized protein LOC132616102 isoform X2 [Lycium barbarum]|uniref:uncharacterized protein LOC132616102 isoform X2 n=1 Tax=Lycium barbarum TaxID=112863 RepID=UPI00293E9791|nr:uncharacterized protein LOC132616102 isoform X2 [Lycium barbarum]